MQTPQIPASGAPRMIPFYQDHPVCAPFSKHLSWFFRFPPSFVPQLDIYWDMRRFFPRSPRRGRNRSFDFFFPSLICAHRMSTPSGVGSAKSHLIRYDLGTHRGTARLTQRHTARARGFRRWARRKIWGVSVLLARLPRKFASEKDASIPRFEQPHASRDSTMPSKWHNLLPTDPLLPCATPSGGGCIFRRSAPPQPSGPTALAGA